MCTKERHYAFTSKERHYAFTSLQQRTACVRESAPTSPKSPRTSPQTSPISLPQKSRTFPQNVHSPSLLLLHKGRKEKGNYTQREIPRRIPASASAWSMCVAVCCNALQCVAVCCNVAVCCSVLRCVAVCYDVFRCVEACCHM